MILDKLLLKLELEYDRSRGMRLAGILKENSKQTLNGYEISLSKTLTEYEQYKKLKNSNFYYRFDTQHSDRHSMPHYHIYPNKDRTELFAVNVDGTAHHKKNKHKIVPKKIADDLRNMGVAISSDNMIEVVQTVLHDEEDRYFITLLD